MGYVSYIHRRKGDGNKKKIPASKRYIVYPGTIQGRRALVDGMRRRTRVGRCWATVAKFAFPDNSFWAQDEFM